MKSIDIKQLSNFAKYSENVAKAEIASNFLKQSITYYYECLLKGESLTKEDLDIMKEKHKQFNECFNFLK